MNWFDETTDEWKLQKLVGKCLCWVPQFKPILEQCRDRNSTRWDDLKPGRAFTSQHPAYLKFWERMSADVIEIAGEVLKEDRLERTNGH